MAEFYFGLSVMGMEPGFAVLAERIDACTKHVLRDGTLVLCGNPFQTTNRPSAWEWLQAALCNFTEDVTAGLYRPSAPGVLVAMGFGYNPDNPSGGSAMFLRRRGIATIVLLPLRCGCRVCVEIAR